MTSISSMAASSALTILTNMTQSKTKTEADSQSVSMSILAPASSAFGGAGRAEKSVSSAIFNAVTNVTEQDETIKSIFKYIEENYTNFENKYGSFDAIYDRSAAEEARQHQKDLGEKIKQIVLSDPEGAKKKLSTIMKQRPDISLNDAMPFLVNELTENNPAMSAGNAAATQPSSTDPAEGAMDLIARIQTEMRYYTASLSNKRFRI